MNQGRPAELTFAGSAFRFHYTADRISNAAGATTCPAVLSALGETLAICTGCHSVFKQRVVDDTTWALLTRQAPPLHPSAGTTFLTRSINPHP